MRHGSIFRKKMCEQKILIPMWVWSRCLVDLGSVFAFVLMYVQFTFNLRWGVKYSDVVVCIHIDTQSEGRSTGRKPYWLTNPTEPKHKLNLETATAAAAARPRRLPRLRWHSHGWTMLEPKFGLFERFERFGRSGRFGSFWTFLDPFGHFWTFLNVCGHFWTLTTKAQ